MITIGNSEISAIFYGSREISAVYKGSTLIWQKQVPPVPSSQLVYAMLSGTGAYAKYNGLWTPSAVVGELIGFFGFYKADQALSGNLNDNTFISLNNVNWPEYDVETTYSALGYKDWSSAIHGSPIFYCKDYATYPSTYLNATYPMNFSASGFTQGESTVTPSTVYWYNGNYFEMTSGGHPGVLISSYLSSVPFDESYKTMMIVEKYNWGTAQGCLGPFTLVSGLTWCATDFINNNFPESGYIFGAGYWNRSTHKWEPRTTNISSEWSIITANNPIQSVAYLQYPSSVWPWMEPNDTNWRLLSLDEEERYGKVKFVPAVESFKGYKISGAAVDAVNGNYILSGTYNGHNKYMQENGTGILVVKDDYWQIFGDETMLEMAYAGYYRGSLHPCMTNWYVTEYGSAPAPSVSYYMSFGDEGGGGRRRRRRCKRHRILISWIKWNICGSAAAIIQRRLMERRFIFIRLRT